MTSLSRRLAGSALAGAASGARSFTGLAALTLATRPGGATQPDRFLGRRWVKVTAGLLGAQEYALDKIPSGPSRLAPPGLASRAVGAAGSAVIISRRAPDPATGPATGPATDLATGPSDPATSPVDLAVCALASLGAAAATAWLGVRWRGRAAARFGPDWIGAVLEDLVTLTLAATAATLTNGSEEADLDA